MEERRPGKKCLQGLGAGDGARTAQDTSTSHVAGSEERGTFWLDLDSCAEHSREGAAEGHGQEEAEGRLEGEERAMAVHQTQPSRIVQGSWGRVFTAVARWALGSFGAVHALGPFHGFEKHESLAITGGPCRPSFTRGI